MIQKILSLFKKSSPIQSINTSNLEALLKQKPKTQVIDVRTAQEYRSGHIPKARNINLWDADFAKKIQKLNKSKAYYVYCKSGIRSRKACKIMLKHGFEEVYNVRGGMLFWKGAKSKKV